MSSSAGHPSSAASPGQREGRGRRMLGQSTRYVSGRTLAGGIGAVAALLLYRVLGPVEAGRLQLVLAAAMTAGTLAGLGFFETLARYVPERGDRGPGLFRRALGANAIAVVAGGGILLALRLTGRGLPGEIHDAWLLFFAYATSYAFFLTALGMLRGLGRLSAIPALDALANVGGKGGAALVALVAAGYRPALALHVAFQGLALLAAFALLRGPARAASVRFTPRETRFGAIILLGMAVQMLLATVDLYLLRLLLGPEDVGIFAAGSRFPLLIEQLVLAPVGVPLLYYFSHPEYRDLREDVVRRGTRLLGAALGFGALALSALAGPFVLLILGEEYRESVAVVRIYAAHALGVGLITFFAPLYTSADRPEYAVAQGGATFALNVALSLLLIPRFGPAGAAASGAIAVFVTAWGASVFVARRFHVDVRGPILGISLLFGLAFAAVQAGWWWAGLTAYPVLLVAGRLIGPADWKLLRRGGGR